MKKFSFILTLLLVFQTTFGTLKHISSNEIIDLAKKVADSNIATPRVSFSLTDWVIAPYYDGLIELAKISGEPKYWAEVINCGNAVAWNNGKRKYHADDYAISHAWLATYLADTSKKERMLKVKEGLDKIILDASTYNGEAPLKKHFGRTPVCAWNWCDALYMAPITFLRMYIATGEQKYLDYMNKEYKWTTNLLFDTQDNMFYRDTRFIGKKSPNGKKIFWGRGNGWVIGGLTLILNDMPKDNPSYPYYKDLYLKMAKAIAKTQLKNGLWGVNLADNLHYQGGETSSSAFIAYALAWGINNNLLDNSYKSIITKAWQGLKSVVDENYTVGYVQPIGASPDKFSKDTTQLYGIGAFLMASAEIAKLCGATQPIATKKLIEQANNLNKNANSAKLTLKPDNKNYIIGNSEALLDTSKNKKTPILTIIKNGKNYKPYALIRATPYLDKQSYAQLRMIYYYKVESEIITEFRIIKMSNIGNHVDITSFFGRGKFDWIIRTDNFDNLPKKYKDKPISNLAIAIHNNNNKGTPTVSKTANNGTITFTLELKSLK
ncbi:MAG: hypothetical protein E7035_05630 [Verrucomicrobiaceae bacterium]|nr:hypothetical protein [Verrucomicrobiaceae bacterium]